MAMMAISTAFSVIMPSLCIDWKYPFLLWGQYTLTPNRFAGLRLVSEYTVPAIWKKRGRGAGRAGFAPGGELSVHVESAIRDWLSLRLRRRGYRQFHPSLARRVVP